MKLKLPELEISEAEGFVEEKDIFGRREYGDRLANVFVNSDDGVVVALDGAWGTGKSTFIQMWCGHAQAREQTKLKTIRFDAFKNDFQKDAFLAIASEIEAIVPQAITERFVKGAIEAGKAITRGALKLGLRVGTAGVLDGTELESIGEDVGKLISGQAEAIIKDRLENAKADKESIQHFREVLQESVIEIQDVEHVVFVIDELDRCKPDYALEILEVIKHFFSVDGLSFLLVVNRGQLEASIHKQYGHDIDAEIYLNKFVHLFTRLPRTNPAERQSFASKFYHHCRNVMTDGTTTDVSAVLERLVIHFEPSFREIERLVGMYNVASSAGLVDYMGPFTYDDALVSYCVWVSVMKPKLLVEAAQKEENGHSLIEESGLEGYEHTLRNRENIVQRVIDCVLFDKGDDEYRESVGGDNSNFASYFTGGINRNEFKNRLIRVSTNLAQMSVT